MRMRAFLLMCGLAQAVSLSPGSQRPLGLSDADLDQTTKSVPELGPNVDSAIAHSSAIFNAVHVAMRQWGSSLKHNGVSYFVATVPAGTTFYHGGADNDPVQGPEWLAFEIEHAAMFAHKRLPHPPRGNGSRGEREEEHPPAAVHDVPAGPARSPIHAAGGWSGYQPGYFHTFRTDRPLRLLYIDGMSAGKCDLGTLDSQDLVLMNLTQPRHGFYEYERAVQLCAQSHAWGVDGFLRMEAGFEIIHCNFSQALTPQGYTRRPDYDAPEGNDDLAQLEYVRSLAARYHDIGGQRVTLDFSSMVSAYFYPFNFTNPDVSHAELPRLSNLDGTQTARLKDDVVSMLQAPSGAASVNWQNVVDLIVHRYAGRLQFLTDTDDATQFLAATNSLLNIYVDYEHPSVAAAVARCAAHYLPDLPATASPTDHLLLAAVGHVSQHLCATLFDVRAAVLADFAAADGNDVDAGRRVNPEAQAKVAALMSWLDWTAWQDCPPCAWDEVCFVAMWPLGGREDHYHPQCRNASALSANRTVHGGEYWTMGLLSVDEERVRVL